MKTFKLVIILLALYSCKPDRPVRLSYDYKISSAGYMTHGIYAPAIRKKYWYITINNQYIDTTATFDYQLAYKYYLTLKKRYNEK